MQLCVSGLWVYPIKSCRGIAVDSFELDDRGPIIDRRFMLVDRDHRFITQREVPRMALIDVGFVRGEVHVNAPGAYPFTIPAPPREAAFSDCTIFHDTVPLAHVDAAADAWFSEALEIDCRLMYMPRTTERVVDRDYSPERRLVSLADAYPLLLIGEGSLELLNEKLLARGESPVPMKRFRPNIVVSGTQPHEEDEWKQVRIGDVDCKVVKSCARCTIPTVDTETGVRGIEPSRTLATYRKQGSKILFGQNVIHTGPAVMHRGDVVLPQSTQSSPR
jgi:uncharacterized protein